MAQQIRKELGDFLRKRRELLDRDAFGLPMVGKSRRQGLRREEVAYHSGLSVTWYTWLEQGRDINPSRQVLDAVATSLRLSIAEREYVLSLAGYAPGTTEAITSTIEFPAHLQHLLDAQQESPAFAITAEWGIAAWNRAYEVLYPGVATAEAEDRNLLVAIFTDPTIRSLLPDWSTTSRQFLAEYRAEVGSSAGDPALARLVSRLKSISPEFAAAWDEHRIDRFASRERRFNHPAARELRFEHCRLTPSDAPQLHVIIYLPLDAETHTTMRDLLDAVTD